MTTQQSGQNNVPQPKDPLGAVSFGRLPHPGPKQWLVDQFLPLNDTSTFYGSGGSFKSGLATHLALCVLTGNPFLIMPVEQGPVLWLDFESHQDDAQRSAWALNGGKQPPSDFYYKRVHGALEGYIDHIQKAVEHYGIKLVIVDSVEMAMARGRDYTEDATRFMGAIDYLDCSRLLIDHTPKGSDSEFASVFKYNLARAQYLIQWEEEPSQNSHGILRMDSRKMSYGVKPKPVHAKVEFNPGKVSVSRAVVTPTPTNIPSRDPVMDSLSKLTTPTADDIAKDSGLSKAQVYKALDLLIQANEVTKQPGHPATYRIR